MNTYEKNAVGEEYLIINGQQVVRAGENYDNPETGEYIHWVTNPNAKGTIAKEFTFKIRHSVMSSKFTVDSTSVSISCNACVTDMDNDYVAGFLGHEYTVNIVGIFTRTLLFDTGGTESGSISGLKKGGEYRVEIINVGDLADIYYLQGSGKITNN